MGDVLCGANAANMKFFLDEERYGILPQAVKEELKVLCVCYCADVGGVILFSFDADHSLRLSTIEPIDEIGAELKIKEMRAENKELFSMLEEFHRAFGKEE